jgi:hypothetical protein
MLGKWSNTKKKKATSQKRKPQLFGQLLFPVLCLVWVYLLVNAVNKFASPADGDIAGEKTTHNTEMRKEFSRCNF